MRIEVHQLPSVEYSPNWRGSRFEKYRAGKVYQEAVYYYCVDVRNRAMASSRWAPFGRARVDLTFIFPQSRRRDRDNLIARFKPGLDAIVQAGLVADDDVDHLEIGHIAILVSRERAPLTIIDLEGVTNGKSNSRKQG